MSFSTIATPTLLVGGAVLGGICGEVFLRRPVRGATLGVTMAAITSITRAVFGPAGFYFSIVIHVTTLIRKITPPAEPIGKTPPPIRQSLNYIIARLILINRAWRETYSLTRAR